MEELTEQELVRRDKMNKLIQKGIEPFGCAYEITHNSKEIKENYEVFSNEELEEKNIKVSIAGRIMTKRIKGKAGFMHIQDKFGQIQIYLKIDNIGEESYELFDDADIGDIVGIKGSVFRTHMGELSIKAYEYTHLVKALKPLPEKFHGLIDIEERFRKKYLDLIMNEDSRKIAFIRPKVIRSIQNYLDSNGYVEVETPILANVSSGATAKPFVTHHNTLDQDMYLRIATEIPLKKLIVGGMDAVYEIGRLFRNEGMDRNHNPEFTTVEIYKAYSDLSGMMNLCENLIKKVLMDINGSYELEWKGHLLDFSKPFKRISMVDIIRENTGIDFLKIKDLNEAVKIAKEHDIIIEKHFKIGHIINEFFEKYCEDKLIEPTFLYGHPIEITTLAKKSKDPRFTERFELFICGSEYGNAYSELNDPIDQRERLEVQIKEKELGNEEAEGIDFDFLNALEHGMPPTGGIGIGIDRLVMLVTKSENIREIILFPHMKNKKIGGE
jgi:lysyl-tRNA synthetase class 2